MEEQIAKAKNSLTETGYTQKKCTETMAIDANECEAKEERG